MKRLVCFLLGHRWVAPIPFGASFYATGCERCQTPFVGTWAEIESRGVWEHYR